MTTMSSDHSAPQQASASKPPALAITPPGTARRILPLFSPPGCHMYDSYLNCFQHRPELRKKLRDAARLHAAHRYASLHSAEHQRQTRRSAGTHGGGEMTRTPPPPSPTRPEVPCHCALDAAQLFASARDVPQPPLPLSKCELHEVLAALPPRWQNYPWRLCYDTAMDGFSLATMYRAMESIEEQQTHSKTVAFALFFVTTRAEPSGLQSVAEAAPASGGGQQPAISRTVSATNVAGSGASSTASPTHTGTSRAFSTAQRSSALRYGAQRGTLPHSVIGCFTPEVPSLAHHAANVYFGSADTAVFRLDQMNATAAAGQWIERSFQRAAERQMEKSCSVYGTAEGLARGAKHVDDGGTGDGLSGGSWSHSGGLLSLSQSITAPHPAPPPRSGAVKSVMGYAQFSDSAEQTHVPVPMPTHMTIEALRQSTQKSSATVTSPLLVDLRSEEAASARASGGRHVSAEGVVVPPPHTLAPLPALVTPVTISKAATVPQRTAPVSPPKADGRRSTVASVTRGITPRAPLLSKYGWAGRPDNRKFLVCNPHFFAVGAGKSGAALYLDEALQYGTSSRWCETFNAPCLFGPRLPDSPPASQPATPATASPPSRLGAARTAAGAPAAAQSAERQANRTPPAGMGSLPHREFTVSRVVWFSITEDRRSFRLMNGAGAEAVMGGSMEDRQCSCGRVYRPGESDALGGGDLSSPTGMTYMHQCDLLPFAEQPY